MNVTNRIAYLVSQYPAVNHTYILREIRELRKLGWDIHVASIRPDIRPCDQLTQEEHEEQSRTWCVKTQGFGRALLAHLACLLVRPHSYVTGLLSALSLARTDPRKAAWNFLYFTEALLVGRWMQSNGLRHVHVHFASTVGLLVSRTFPITISMTIHGPAEFEEPRTFHLREKIQAATFICAISSYGRSQLMKACDPAHWDKLAIVRLGIDPDAFTPGSRPSSEHRTFEIISVAQLKPAKAQRILIDAVAKLVNEGRPVRLRLVGDGPDRHALENHIRTFGLSDVVRLEGALNQDRLRTLYRNSDAFALASFAEGIPVVLMEAMAMEIPCVATWITGIPELIQNGVDGLLVPPSDVDQLAAAIGRLIGDPELRTRIAKSGRRKVLQQYCLSDNTASLAKAFEKRVLSLVPSSD